MNEYTIKNATAEYTGGGIYIYYGELNDGKWFRTETTWSCTHICTADTTTEEANYSEFYDEYTFDVLHDIDHESFFNDMVLWIIHNAPKGNYNIDELEESMYKWIETTIKIEHAQRLESDIHCSVKQEKFDSMLNRQLSAIQSTMSEYRNGCNFFFADKSMYSRDYEKQWYDEFYNSAKRIFESKGYYLKKHSNYTYIHW